MVGFRDEPQITLKMCVSCRCWTINCLCNYCVRDLQAGMPDGTRVDNGVYYYSCKIYRIDLGEFVLEM